MKKSIMLLAAVFAGSVLFATEIDLKSDFGKTQKNDMPYGWRMHVWEGYKPYAKYTIASEGGFKAFHISGIKAKGGACYVSHTYFPAKAGDIITVTAKVKGSGTVWIGAHVFADKKWVGELNREDSYLTEDWKTFTVSIPVKNMKGKTTTEAQLTFGALQNSDMYIADIKASIEGK